MIKGIESKYMNYLQNKKILLTGGNGFVGKHVYAQLIKNGLLKADIFIPRSNEYDLRIPEVCNKITKDIEVVIHLAGNVGGIGYNRENPGRLFYDNISMGVNLIEASRLNKIDKFIQVGTICSYPKFTPIPFQEDSLWDGYPEETNAPYGIAKKALLVMLQAYKDQYNFKSVYLLPVNMYGPGDNFNPASSHVIASLIKKISDAIKNKSENIVVWGDGSATREFFYVEDAAKAIVLASEICETPDPMNIGAGFEISIKDLINTLVPMMQFNGKIIWDTSKPNGQPRRMLDTSKALNKLNFKATTSFEKGLQDTINWYEKNY